MEKTIGITINKSKATKTSKYYIMPPLTKETFLKRRVITKYNHTANYSNLIKNKI